MSRNRNTTGRMLLAIVTMLLISLAACTPGADPVPTQDTVAIFTAAAQTVQAELSQTAAAMPAPTDTPQPSPTATQPIPTLAPIGAQETPGGTNTAVVVITLPSAGQATSMPPAGGAVSSIEAQWVSNNPADDALVLTNAKFDITWTIRNVGKNTWNKNYYIQHFSGPRLAEKSIYYLREDVAPDATTNVVIDAFAPSTTGTVLSWWKVKNDQGQNIGDLTIQLRIVAPGETPTETPES